MKYLLLVAATVQSALAHPGSPHPDAQGRYTIEAEGIRAQFIPYAATLTNLFVKGGIQLYTQARMLIEIQMLLVRNWTLSWVTTTPLTTVSFS